MGFAIVIESITVLQDGAEAPLSATAVCVLPYDPQRDEVVLIEQFRVGVLAALDGKTTYQASITSVTGDELPRTA